MLTIALVTLAVGYLAIVGLVYANQRKLLYFPPPALAVDATDGVESLRVTYPGGSVPAFHLRATGGAPTLAWFHGNGEQISGLVQLARRLHDDAGLGFFAAEYPGYPGSLGDGTWQESIVASAHEALAQLQQRGVAPDRLVLVGRSLGTGVAVQLASQGLGARLALVSPYTSITDRAAQIYPWLPVRLLVQDRFDSAALAPSLKLATLVIHGDRDDVVPAELGRALAALLPNARLHLVPGAGHDDILDAPGVRATLVQFASTPAALP